MVKIDTNKTGLIIDIDDTLTDTAFTAIQTMWELYGHELSPQELTAKYLQPGNVPEWQSLETQSFLNKLMTSEDFLLNLPPVPDSQEVVLKLSENYPVKVYITSRSEIFAETTKRWLNKNNFPIREIIFGEHGNLDNAWKITYLIKTGLDNNVFIDNELSAFATDLESYRGKLIWFNRYQRKKAVASVVSVSSWKDVKNEVIITQRVHPEG